MIDGLIDAFLANKPTTLWYIHWPTHPHGPIRQHSGDELSLLSNKMSILVPNIFYTAVFYARVLKRHDHEGEKCVFTIVPP